MKVFSRCGAIFLICCLIMALLPFPANAGVYDVFAYEIQDNQVTITGCAKTAQDKVIVPDTIEGYPVTAIGEKGTKTFTHGEALPHTYDGNCDTSCNVCNAVRTAPHSYTEEWKNDELVHWHECNCGAKTSEAAHAWDDGATTDAGTVIFKCTTCGAQRVERIVTPPEVTEPTVPSISEPTTPVQTEPSVINPAPVEPATPEQNAPSLIWILLVLLFILVLLILIVFLLKRKKQAKRT